MQCFESSGLPLPGDPRAVVCQDPQLWSVCRDMVPQDQSQSRGAHLMTGGRLFALFGCECEGPGVRWASVFTSETSVTPSYTESF